MNLERSRSPKRAIHCICAFLLVAFGFQSNDTLAEDQKDSATVEVEAPIAGWSWNRCAKVALGDSYSQRLSESPDETLRSFVESRHTAIGRLCDAIAAAWISGSGENLLLEAGEITAETYRQSRIDVFNALAVDFATDPSIEQPAQINPAALVRLIAVSDLLPESMVGGLVLKNFNLTGALILDNIEIEMPVALINARFKQELVNRSHLDIGKYYLSISINGSFLKKRLYIKGYLEGAVRIVGTRVNSHLFLHNLDWFDAAKKEESLAEPLKMGTTLDRHCGEGQDWQAPRLSIVDSIINGSMYVQGVAKNPVFCAITIVRSDINTISIIRQILNTVTVRRSNIKKFVNSQIKYKKFLLFSNIIGKTYAEKLEVIPSPEIISSYLMYLNDIGELIMSRSELDSLEIIDNRFGDLSVEFGRIGGAIRIVSNKFDNKFEIFKVNISNWQNYITKNMYNELKISQNQIFGSFLFKPDLDESIIKIDLNANFVKRSASIHAPRDWRGEIDFSASQFESELLLAVSLPESDDESKGTNELKRQCVRISDFRGADRHCSKPLSHPVTRTSERKGRDKILKMTFNLEAVQARRLNWEMPLAFPFCWQGAGFRYESWSAKAFKTCEGWENQARSMKECEFCEEGRKELTAGLGKWKTLISQQHTKVDALTYMSEFLDKRGERSDVQDLLREAKRLDFGHSAKYRDDSVESVGRQFVTVIKDFAAIGLCLFDDHPFSEGHPFFRENARKCAVGSFVLLFLGPSGYGANPEWALLSIVVVWVVFTFIYRFYSSCLDPGSRISKSQRAISRRLFGVSRSTRFVWLPQIWVKLRTWLKGPPPTPRSHVQVPVAGFVRSNADVVAAKFSSARYSLDATLPVLNLHVYDSYIPTWSFLRLLAAIQHLIGWWLITSFLASLAILAT